jgi:hypothetical protein
MALQDACQATDFGTGELSCLIFAAAFTLRWQLAELVHAVIHNLANFHIHVVAILILPVGNVFDRLRNPLC